MSEVERRRAERIPIGLRVEFDSGTGLSRDVSGLGVYFETDNAEFEPGNGVRFTMFIPDAVNVACVGNVMRVDELEDDRFGVACTIDEFELAEEGAEGATSHLIIDELKRHH
ncbi:MAG: PilZ domain-containing protein [Thermoanaerobaculia bacterium]|nr:PilZ domain-containing protein [Thermoanaerobaculia bacterium]